ncbi:MAG: hypothetical protein GXP05_16865 [Alphaproteobacteria bacterium]|nr:hypothetical protein [Alphaproteobacteria bacterium]
MKWIRYLPLVLGVLAAPAAAQEPLSAIDWLSKSVREKPVAAPVAPDVSGPIQSPEITVTPLAGIRKDTVGLLPSAVTGLPPDFWGGSNTETITRLISRQRTDSLPEVLSLLYTILLAEVNAPGGALSGSDLLLARTDKLLDLGALNQAQALLERAGPNEPEIFRRWFDISLLTGHEEHACTAMRAAPGFAPTMEARVFCLARGGDWDAAALTLATGETLGFIKQSKADLITRFLDPQMFEGQPDLPPPTPLTPLEFTMREAIAQPRPAGALPLAFANVDLRSGIAWRNQMRAAERLVRSQAVPARRLIEFYTQRKPAASGGIWDRVRAIQAFDVALLSGDNAGIDLTLPTAYNAMREVALEVPFARYYGDRLAGRVFSKATTKTAFKIALLSDGFENSARKLVATSDRQAFLKGLALGNVAGLTPPGTLGQAIADAFEKPMPEGSLRDLLTEKRLGEAILRTMLLLKDESFADPGDIRAALSTFRAVGLEQEARRIAIQLLLLERLG